MGAIPQPPTFTAGEVPSAAKMNSIRDAITFWALTPRCSCYMGTTQTIAHNTTTAVQFQGEIYDIPQAGDSDHHSTTSNTSRIVIRTPGKYEIVGQVRFTGASSAGVRRVAVRLNGSDNLVESQVPANASGSSTDVTVAPLDHPLAAGDYLELTAFQNSGVAMDIFPGAGLTFLRIRMTGS